MKEHDINGSPTISLTDAEEKYGVPQPTLSYWVRTGKVNVIQDQGPGYPKLVDEVDVAAQIKLWRQRRQGRGRRPSLATA